MMGAGVTKNEIVDLVEKKNIYNIMIYNPVNRNELIKWIKKSTLCIVPLKNDNLFKTAMPSKMFEYMAW